MKIIIYRGTHQIGGCITEIQSSKGTRIAIDIGENLPTINKKENTKINVEGLNTGKPSFNAVFITHYHGDHIGLYNKIYRKIPVYIGEHSKQIFKILQERLEKVELTSKKDLERIDSFFTYKIPQKIKVNDILVTPIEVDHSAFNAHMFLVECDGKRLLHTGDFRLHGQRGKSVIKALKKYVGKVDILICEGTTLSRNSEKIITENELQKRAEEIFKDNKYNFVMCSSTNIDRIAAIHKAALKEKRLFVCDKYQKDILMYIDSIARSRIYKFKGKALSYDNNILPLMQQKGFVMLVRDNYISKNVIQQFPNSTFIYSQWNGYLNEKFTEYKHLQEFVPKNHIYLHTSGHADFKEIKKVCATVQPKMIIPIHSEKPEVFEQMRIKRLYDKISK